MALLYIYTDHINFIPVSTGIYMCINVRYSCSAIVCLTSLITLEMCISLIQQLVIIAHAIKDLLSTQNLVVQIHCNLDTRIDIHLVLTIFV